MEGALDSRLTEGGVVVTATFCLVSFNNNKNQRKCSTERSKMEQISQFESGDIGHLSVVPEQKSTNVFGSTDN